MILAIVFGKSMLVADDVYGVADETTGLDMHSR